MANSPNWSNQRRSFISALIPNKKILFANVNGNGIAKWKADCKNYDLIVGYYKSKSIYIICKAEQHIGTKSSDFSSMTALFQKRYAISVGYKKSAVTPITQERVLIVTENKIEQFSGRLEYYLNTYQPKK